MRLNKGKNFRQLKAITIFKDFFQNPSHFHTNWLIFEGLVTKVNLNQIQKYFGMGLLGPKSNFKDPKLLLIPERSHVQSTLMCSV
jgi:hypothetical protein